MSNKINTQHNVLDHGFVRVVETMGNDYSIVQAARVSYGHGTTNIRQDEALIRYLMYHNHTSPFEMCEIKLHIKLPIFVARQWVRHRTASINEYSGRYSIIKDDFYVPREIFGQHSKKKQCSDTDHKIDDDLLQSEMKECYESCYALYKKMILKGVARETARIVLPVSLYTEIYWKIDLHNLLHFLKLRSSSDAQLEIREYGNVILYKILPNWLPIVYRIYCELQDKKLCNLT